MDFFKCHLCSYPFDINTHTPRMMPDCGHTFCQSCIVKRIAQGAIICPEDDSMYENTDINDFPVNTTLVQILQRNTKKPEQRKIDIFPHELEFEPVDSITHLDSKSSNKQQKLFEVREEDELKKLLTPQDFLKNLLGSLHDQGGSVQSDSIDQNRPLSPINHTILPVTQRSVSPHSRPPANTLNFIQTFPSERTEPLDQLVNEKENEFKQQVNAKFDDLFKKLNDRKTQILEEVHLLFQRIFQQMNNQVQRMPVSSHEIKRVLNEVVSKINPEYQLQLELMIPRYCSLRSSIDPIEFNYEIPQMPQKTPSFAPQGPTSRKLFESEDEFPSKPHESLKENTLRKTEESLFLTFEQNNNQFMNDYAQPRKHNEFNVPYDITNHRITPVTKNTGVSPPKRIFDEFPASPLLRVKQPLFQGTPFRPETAAYSSQASQEKILDKVLDKLQKGMNIEVINLKDQNISDRDVQNLGDQLKSTISFVRTIKLSRNNITNEGFKYLLESVRKNRTLKTLNLKRNKLTETCLQILINEYQPQKGNYLSQLFLKGNNIDTNKWIAELTQVQKLGILIYM